MADAGRRRARLAGHRRRRPDRTGVARPPPGRSGADVHGIGPRPVRRLHRRRCLGWTVDRRGGGAALHRGWRRHDPGPEHLPADFDLGDLGFFTYGPRPVSSSFEALDVFKLVFDWDKVWGDDRSWLGGGFEIAMSCPSAAASAAQRIFNAADDVADAARVVEGSPISPTRPSPPRQRQAAAGDVVAVLEDVPAGGVVAEASTPLIEFVQSVASSEKLGRNLVRGRIHEAPGTYAHPIVAEEEDGTSSRRTRPAGSPRPSTSTSTRPTTASGSLATGMPRIRAVPRWASSSHDRYYDAVLNELRLATSPGGSARGMLNSISPAAARREVPAPMILYQLGTTEGAEMVSVPDGDDYLFLVGPSRRSIS